MTEAEKKKFLKGEPWPEPTITGEAFRKGLKELTKLNLFDFDEETQRVIDPYDNRRKHSRR